jgi:hypothetical protein
MNTHTGPPSSRCETPSAAEANLRWAVPVKLSSHSFHLEPRHRQQADHIVCAIHVHAQTRGAFQCLDIVQYKHYVPWIKLL